MKDVEYSGVIEMITRLMRTLHRRVYTYILGDTCQYLYFRDAQFEIKRNRKKGEKRYRTLQFYNFEENYIRLYLCIWKEIFCTLKKTNFEYIIEIIFIHPAKIRWSFSRKRKTSSATK